MAESTRRREADWALFADWCAATGQHPLPASLETVEAWLRFCPGAAETRRRRWRSLRQVHAAHGLQLDVPARPPVEPERPWRIGDGWADPATALAGCPTVGWPAGMHGRRDAFLIVLAGVLGYSRGRMLRLSADDIALSPDEEAPVVVGGQPVPVGVDAWRCPACAVVRWLQVAGLSAGRSRWAAREALTQPMPGHVCSQPIPDYWKRDLWHLCPSIDRWGVMVEWRALHPRSISAILAFRQSDPGTIPQPVEASLPVADDSPRVDRSDWTDDEVLAEMERRVAAADEVLARIETYLAAEAPHRIAKH